MTLLTACPPGADGDGRRVPGPGLVRITILLASALAAPSHASAQAVTVDARIPLDLGSSLGIPGLRPPIGAAVIDQHRILLAELETNSIVTFDRHGEMLARLRNDGPDGARIAYPVSMASAGVDEVMVLDAQIPRLVRIGLSPGQLKVLSVLRLRGLTGVSAACRLQGTDVVMGVAPPDTVGPILHTLDAQGQIESSFGEGFGPRDEASRLLFGAGRLLCLPSPALAVAASQYYPEVRAYDARGALRWQHTIPGYRSVSIVRPSPRRVEYAFPPDSLWDRTVGLFQVGRGLLGVQVARYYGRQPDSKPRSIRTYLISATTGHVVGEQADLPLVLAADTGRFISLDNDGRPWVLTYSDWR